LCIAAGWVGFGPVIQPAAAREVRVATYNILNGTGQVGSDAYNATRAVLGRMDADIVCFQELYATTYAAWTNMAAELGYPYTAMGGNNSTADSYYLGYFSRFPILATNAVTSPPGANELTRLPFRAVVDVPDTQRPLVLWTMHHKASSGSIDKFRRAIEAYRIGQDIHAYLADHPDHVEYVLTGDMNEDIRDYQAPAQFTSQPSGAPGYYVLGSDITFPVPYATFPTDRYADAGAGLLHMPAFWEDSATPVTRPESGRQLDYVFLSPALMASPLGSPQAEVYYSETDLGGGLPKAGAPLPAGTCAASSDHLPIFVDLHMADFSAVLPSATFAATGEVGGPFEPEYQTYTVTETNGVDSLWFVEADVDWLGVDIHEFNLSPHAAIEVDVFLNASAAALPPGIHAGAVLFWNETFEQMETRQVVLTIRDTLAIGPADGLAAVGNPGGPFSPAEKIFVISNKQAAVMAFTATGTESWLTLSPANGQLQGGEAVEVTVALNANAAALPVGQYSDTVVISNQTTGLIHQRPVTLSIIRPLCDAVDRCDLPWTTGGDADWFHQTNTSADGVDAAQSGAIGPSQHTWLETTVTGPVNVHFHWKTSCRSSHYLRWHVDGSPVTSISGQTEWTNRMQELAAGPHTLRWVFTNTTTAPEGSNAVWVDQVVLDYLTATPSATWYPSGLPGGPFSAATREYVLTNAGPEAITWSAAPNADWLTILPGDGVLESGASTTVLVMLNEEADVLPVGSHSGGITFSNQTTGTTFQRQVWLNIQDYLVISPSYLWFEGFAGGPPPPAQYLTVSNSGPDSAEWSITPSTNWATATPADGLLAPGETVAVEVAISSATNMLRPGWLYLELAFSNITTEILQYRIVYLSLAEPLAASASASAISGPVGGPFSPGAITFTLTNQSPVAQTWSAADNANWLALDHTGGTLAGHSATAITATINANASSLPMGSYSAGVVFSNPATGSRIEHLLTLSAGIVFCEALEACDREWTLGGTAPWQYQTNVTHDGADAAVSGPVGNSQESWMQTVAPGPGTLSFWWKVSSESNWDFLEFWIDQVRTNRISGDVDWHVQSYELGPGEHSLAWRYVKDGSVSNGTDRGWVDFVTWSPARTAMGVPIAWYQRFGLAPAQNQTWDDLDWLPAASTVPNWFQYRAGLDPTDPEDSFRVRAIQQPAGEPVRLEWWGGTNGPATPYLIQSTLDLQHGPWEPIGTSPRVPGWNIWTNDAPPEAMRYFRILAPTDPAP